MHLTQSNNLRKLDKNTFSILRQLSSLSKNMYNVGLYNVRQNFFENGSFLNYFGNYKISKENENFPLLTTIGQCILKEVDSTFRSFFGLLKAKKTGRINTKINLPHYLPKDSFHAITWNRCGIKVVGNQVRLSMSKEFKKMYDIKERYLWFPKPPMINEINIQEVKITPQRKATYFKIHFTYKQEPEQHDLDANEYLSIDLGINNFASCVDTKTGTSFILDGRKLKSINQFWNKRIAKLKSTLDKQEPKSKRWSKLMFKLTDKRNNRVNEFMKQSVNHIVKHCLEHKIGNIVIGEFGDIQRNSNMGKRNNQTFVQIPFAQFKMKLENKCQQHGIVTIRQEESYTSKCSFLDTEECCKHETYVGKRIRRGLFRTMNGNLVNADVNGACNILSKYFKKSKQKLELVFKRLCNGLINSPRRIRVLDHTSSQTM